MLQTITPNEYFAFSPDSELFRNVEAFYSTVQSKKGAIDGHTLQTGLHDLLSFPNPKTIWNSAVLTELRLCVMGYPNEGVTDMVIDYCFQFVRLATPAMTSSNQKVPKKEGRSGEDA